MLRNVFRYLINRTGDIYKDFIFGDMCKKGVGTRLLKDCIIENLQKKTDAIVLGKDCMIRGHLLVWKHGGKIEIGDDTFIGLRSEIQDIVISRKQQSASCQKYPAFCGYIR